MWETEFYPELLDERSGVIINCPTEEAERGMASILAAHGILYPDGQSPIDIPKWDSYEDKFCYFVDHGVVRRGPIIRARNQSNDWCFKCTFFGPDTPDFDTATDDELRSLLGV